MASINARVVRRSNALMGYGYGQSFRYKGAAFPKGFKVGVWALVSRLVGAFVSLFPPTRWVLRRFVLPNPGEGPSETTRNNGYFQILLRGEGLSGQVWHCLVAGDRDPGYGQTAVMLAESALALVHQHEELPKCYGVVTPASALGQPLITRLRSAGMIFDVSAGEGRFSRRKP